MGCKGLTSTTALPDAEILSHCSIVSTISSSIWLFFSMLSIVWSSDRYSHRWPMMSSPRPFCDCILNIELQVLRIHPCTTHFQTCNTLMHISASRGRKQANFTAKKWVKKPRFQDTPLNYMHSWKTSAGTRDFFPHFPCLKDYQENLPVGLLGCRRGTCLTLTSAVCLQAGKCFHPHSHIENQICSQLSAKSLSRIENWVLQKYLAPIFSFHFVHPFSYLLILTSWDILI